MLMIADICGFSGRWHGDVLIHTYDNQTNAEVLEFLRDVANLSRIRHESVCLFMGACLQSPNYAIITRLNLLSHSLFIHLGHSLCQACSPYKTNRIQKPTDRKTETKPDWQTKFSYMTTNNAQALSYCRATCKLH